MTSAPLRPLTRRAGPETSHLYLSQQQTVLIRSEETGGAFALIEELVQAGLEPPAHLHTREDESFYLLEGEVEFQVGDVTYDMARGDCVFLPRGIPHAFKLRSPTAHMLVLLTPGGFERFFLTLARPWANDPAPPTPEDFTQLLTEARRYGIEWVVPGPA
ncbi:quercetin 2,3-dioxygenase [Deinococcus sp. YIM 77859]|uniref:quercetin 2,3-dioxygenase n=1 Tax=Deinococcus sp. YIM 77859 TaxID=1540221 RepID=UPI00054E017D|nr:quercetin 2,3-dioxygenase [Deinococcus sp. YIM 77859]